MDEGSSTHRVSKKQTGDRVGLYVALLLPPDRDESPVDGGKHLRRIERLLAPRRRLAREALSPNADARFAGVARDPVDVVRNAAASKVDEIGSLRGETAKGGRQRDQQKSTSTLLSSRICLRDDENTSDLLEAGWVGRIAVGEDGGDIVGNLDLPGVDGGSYQ